MEVAVDELLRVRDSSDTGPAPTKPPAKKTPPPPSGSSRREREYKRDKDGKFNEVDERGGGRTSGGRNGSGSGRRGGGGGSGSGGGRGRGTKRRTPPPLEFGARNDPDRVRFLQRLLKSLKIANLKEDGIYGESTERAVMALQRKLGLTESGRVSNGLLKRIRDAEILSPCAGGAKRSKEMDEMEEILRAVGLVDEECDCDEDAKGECDCGDEDHDDGDDAPTYRSALLRCCPSEHTFDRVWQLDDIEIVRAGQGGDGRTVVAYAAPFGVPTEIKDQHGHYMETIDRAAFNEAIAAGIHKVGVFYHHGMTLHGTPSDLGSVPIGSPLEIRADGKGLLTRTRYNKTELGESVLQAIKDGDLKGYSFRGPIRKSNPPRIARARSGAPLPTVVRMSLGLNEYGPTPTPYYADAKILAVRSAQAIAADPVARRELQAELARMLSRSTPQDQERESATPTEGPGAEDQPHEALRSASMADIRRRIAVHKILGGRK
jgi:uncharacterized protein